MQFPISGVDVPVLVPPLVAMAVSSLSSPAGVSGAFLLLPFQVSVLGFTGPAVSATNLLYNVVSTPGGVWAHVRARRMLWPLAWLSVAGLVPGTLMGYLVRSLYLPDPDTFRIFAGLVLLPVGLRLLWGGAAGGPPSRSPVGEGAPGALALGTRRARLEYRGASWDLSVPGLFAASLLVGVLGGAYGVGGGVLLAPVWGVVFGLPLHGTAGALLFGTLVSSVTGVACYSLLPVSGQVAPPDWALGTLLGVGGLVGIYLGSRLQHRLPEAWIRRLLGAIVVTVGGKYLLGT